MWYKLGLLTVLIAVVTLPAGLLTGLFVGPTAAWTVFIVGWFLLVPMVPILGSLYAALTESEAEEPPDDPLERLKRRYADGEIGEAEFERRAERLVRLEGIGGSVDVDRDTDLAVAGDESANRNPDRDPERTSGERASNRS